MVVSSNTPAAPARMRPTEPVQTPVCRENLMVPICRSIGYMTQVDKSQASSGRRSFGGYCTRQIDPLRPFEMKWAILLIGLLFSEPSAAQSTPYKLVMLWGSNGVAVVDYPSQSRCEAAAAALQRKRSKEAEQRAPRQAPGGGVIVSPPWQMEFFCLPG